MVRPNAFRAAIMTEMRTTRTRDTLRAISILASALVLVGLGTLPTARNPRRQPKTDSTKSSLS